MKTYLVFEPENTQDAAECAEFVREKFSWPAFFFTPLWLLVKRLWLALVLWCAAIVLIACGVYFLRINGPVSAAVLLLPSLVVAFEGAQLQRFRLLQHGYRETDVVIADDLESAERRYFARRKPAPRRAKAAPAAEARRAAEAAARGEFHPRPVPRAVERAMTVAVIDYGSGNLHSAAKALERASRESGANETIEVTSDPDKVRRADRVVLPGVGAFADCKAGLDAVPGMVEAMQEAVFKRGKPFFGICVGMQLLAERGRENVVTEGFGWLKGEVDKIAPRDKALKIPHMGWNTLALKRVHPLLEGIDLGPKGLHAYFVHSYELKPADNDDLVAEADYGGPVTAMVARGNIAGSQFHPEKSQKLGLALLARFSALAAVNSVVDAWEPFFTAQLGAAAALGGLVFVGLSLNLKKILSAPSLPNRALLALSLLVVILILSSLMLMPGLSLTVVGVLTLALGLVTAVAGTMVQLRALRGTKYTSRTNVITNLVLFECSVLLM